MPNAAEGNRTLQALQNATNAAERRERCEAVQARRTAHARPIVCAALSFEYSTAVHDGPGVTPRATEPSATDPPPDLLHLQLELGEFQARG